MPELESCPFGMLVHRNGVLEAVNSAAAELAGRAPAELVGLALEEVLSVEGEDPPPPWIREEGVDREVWIRFGDGEQRFVRWQARADGQGKGTVVWLNDLTELRQAQDEACARQEQFHEAFLCSPDAQIVTSVVDGQILAVNDSFCSNTGYAREEVVGHSTVELDLWGDASERDNFARLLKQSGAVNNLSTSFLGKNGARIPVLVSARIVQWAGQPAVYGVGRYIGDVREAQARQRRLEERLLQAQKLEAVGTLAGGIAHDFNNLLQVIVGYARMSLLAEECGPRVESHLQRILRAARRAASLVERMLTFARQSEPRLEVVDLASVVTEGVEFLRGALPSTVVIDEALDPGCGRILADPTQIHQVLMNLGTNAVHAMEREKGRLHISCRPVQLDAGAAREHAGIPPGDYVRLEVTDDGRGISPEELPRVMEPFFTTKPPGQGTGLGLSTVHGIVVAHDGWVGIDSTFGEGTRVGILLPVYDEEVGVPPAPVRPVAGRVHRGRVLLVDDEAELVTIVSQSLARYGLQVSGFSSSQEALRAFQADPFAFDVAVVDQTMPEITGLELGRELIRIRPDMPVLMVSGYGTGVNEQLALEAGFRGFFSKPVVDDRLESAVLEIVARE